MKTYTAIISCGDRAGLVTQITGVMYRHSLNVITNHEHVDRQSKRFFMRTQFMGQINEQEFVRELRAVLPEHSICDVRPYTNSRVILFASGEPHCLGDLLLRHENGELRAEVLAVVSQVETCRKLVERFDVPFICVPVPNRDRALHEKQILAAIEKFDADYLILARYMRIFSQDFIDRFKNRIINIHHSFLPAFIGANPYEQAYERGVKMIGATAHFVTKDLDEGPIISQGAIAVDHTLDALAMARRGQDVERTVLATAVTLVLEDRVLIEGNRTIVFE